MMREERRPAPLSCGLTSCRTPAPSAGDVFSASARHPAPGRALGAGPVSPACLDHLLLLHLEGRQITGKVRA